MYLFYLFWRNSQSHKTFDLAAAELKKKKKKHKSYESTYL